MGHHKHRRHLQDPPAPPQGATLQSRWVTSQRCNAKISRRSWEQRPWARYRKTQSLQTQRSAATSSADSVRTTSSPTKMDLGQCPKLHSQKLKEDYEGAIKAAIQSMLSNGAGPAPPVPVRELEGIKREYERNILAFIDECDRRIRAAQRRLEKTPEENNKTTALMREIGEVETAYQLAMQAVEQLGESGQIDESMAELAKAEALKAEKQDKEAELKRLTENSGASGHQKLRVCDVCGAYLSMLDSDRRLADHFGGKMHLGYHQIRLTIDEWRAKGPDHIRIVPPPEAFKAPSAPTDRSTNGDGHSSSNGRERERESSPRRESSKRYSDLPDDADSSRDREKRRRYD